MEHDVRFPLLVAETLSGHPLVLPDGLDGDLVLVVLVFRRHAQSLVDSWLVPVSRRFDGSPGFSWFEVPMLAGGWRVMSGFIDGGMRSGIPLERHDHVATFYGDSSRVRDALEIHDLDSAYAFLVGEKGRVLWSASGWATPKRLRELSGVIETWLARAGHKRRV